MLVDVNGSLLIFVMCSVYTCKHPHRSFSVGKGGVQEYKVSGRRGGSDLLVNPGSLFLLRISTPRSIFTTPYPVCEIGVSEEKGSLG